MNNTNKIEHLKMIQSIISRMANNSFAIKGFSIALTTAILAFLESDKSLFLIIILLFILLGLSLIDAYYLKKEKEFRDLYVVVAKKEDKEIDFSTDLNQYKIKRKFIFTLFSISMIPNLLLLIATLTVLVIKVF